MSGESTVQKKSLADVIQLFKKETSIQVFSYEIYKIFQNPLFYRTPLLSWLLLAVNSVNQ